MSKNRILLLDYNHRYAYWLDKANPTKYKKVRDKWVDEGQAVGYAVLHKNGFWSPEKYLCGLFVEGGSVFFLVGKNCFDVTTEEWVMVREKVGCFSYHLILRKNGSVMLELPFREVAETQPSDPDASFFVDVLHWLKDKESRLNLVKYWSREDHFRKK